MIVVKHPYNPKTKERLVVTYSALDARDTEELPADEREIIAKLLAEK